MEAIPHTTELEFNQAMQDFKTMFPSMDVDVIEVVLRANQGAVDATIDQLLAMSSDTEQEKARQSLPSESNAESQENAVGAAAAIALVPIDQPLRISKGWEPPMLLPLPNDFLRLTIDPRQYGSLKEKIQNVLTLKARSLKLYLSSLI